MKTSRIIITLLLVVTVCSIVCVASLGSVAFAGTRTFDYDCASVSSDFDTEIVVNVTKSAKIGDAEITELKDSGIITINSQVQTEYNIYKSQPIQGNHYYTFTLKGVKKDPLAKTTVVVLDESGVAEIIDVTKYDGDNLIFKSATLGTKIVVCKSHTAFIVIVSLVAVVLLMIIVFKLVQRKRYLQLVHPGQEEVREHDKKYKW